MSEERFIDIEIKLARQEDTIDTLSQTVWHQQRKIAELETLLQGLARRLRQGGGDEDNHGGSDAADERPPHY